MDLLSLNHERRDESSSVHVCCPFCYSYNHHRLDRNHERNRPFYLCHTCGQIFTTRYYEVHPLEKDEFH